MSEQPPANATSRSVGGTEYSWCKAVPGGTGISLLAFLFSKQPDLSHLQTCIHKLQTSHPILRSKLRFDPATNGYSFSTPADSGPPQIQPSDLPKSFELTIEHEMNTNPWLNTNKANQVTETDIMFVSMYNLPEQQWAVVLRLHTAACDRAAAAFLFRELLGLLGGGAEKENAKEVGVGLAIEDYIPAGKANKPFWARGADMLGYSVNSFRFSNLDFKETGFPTSTQLVRMKIGSEDTEKILSLENFFHKHEGLASVLMAKSSKGCKSKGIKLFVLLAAAGIVAARASKNLAIDKSEKYSLTTLMDCRSLLDPALSDHNIGFYHSAILNNHDVKGGEDVWELAQKIYTSLTTAKSSDKHFTDMGRLKLTYVQSR
ncbi:uncharacterized protein LOC143554271 [Bidens hawaiensis]|uniref:uncharacterized protein LOC143554271 n=1 Tax=Bidens hawaiensis TaxID=980011 RepID=UPI00404A188D